VQLDPEAAVRPADRPTGWGPTQGEWRAAQHAVSRLSDARLAGQVIVATYPGTAAPASLVERYHLGGVIELTDNIASAGRLVSTNEQLQESAHRGWPLVISTDQEGGIVQRVGPPLTQFPTFMSYGAADDPALTTAAARASGDELRAAGFTMVFAPDADVTIGPADPTIGSRSAGGGPAAVATQVVAAERGYQRSGIVSVIKHFPGHGSVTSDSHDTLPVQDRSLDQLGARDFAPFAAAVRAGTSAVMIGHIALTAVDPGVPADLSRADVSLLTSRLGFHGLVTTDALNMGAVSDTFSSSSAAVEALKAGADLLLMPADLPAAYQGILDAIRDGSLPRSRVEQAAAKTVALMMHEQHQEPPVEAAIGAHDALSRRVSARALTLVAGACRGPYVGREVTPVGDSVPVAAFTQAARGAGLVVAPGGTTVALVGYGYGPADADVVVSLDTPYVLAGSQASVAKLALYGADVDAMRALVAVLTGRTAARGQLPVSFQGLDEERGC
jgi:beta-N-acetylhexosaminidase